MAVDVTIEYSRPALTSFFASATLSTSSYIRSRMPSWTACSMTRRLLWGIPDKIRGKLVRSLI
jgi:hypothetical protein